MATRVEPITPSDLFTQLISHEQRINLRDGEVQSSANAASKGNRDRGQQGQYRGGGGRNRGGGHGNSGRGNGGRGPSGQQRAPFQPGVVCQLCAKEGHAVINCFKRFDRTFTPPQKSASTAMASYGADSNWYMDSGATDHISSDLDKLTIRDRYMGGDQVHAANGTGMRIEHIGHSILHSPSSNLHLNNILHVPTASKNLVSVNRLARDNNAFLEFHPHHFVIKDQQTKKVLHKGKCERGLYPFKSPPNKQCFGVSKPTRSLWHHRLGHASTPVV